MFINSNGMRPLIRKFRYTLQPRVKGFVSSPRLKAGIFTTPLLSAENPLGFPAPLPYPRYW